MCSFGEGISMTPLQLGALVAAISNGGTLYYLQHPTSPEAVADFQPVIKRHLDIANAIPELSDGMAGAVAYGTARSLRLNFNEESILGKTGTCSHAGTRFGWFASYANTDIGRIVTVVFLQGGTSNLRSEGCRNCRPHVPQSLRPQFLRRPLHRRDSGVQLGPRPRGPVAATVETRLTFLTSCGPVWRATPIWQTSRMTNGTRASKFFSLTPALVAHNSARYECVFNSRGQNCA